MGILLAVLRPRDCGMGDFYLEKDIRFFLIASFVLFGVLSDWPNGRCFRVDFRVVKR